MIGNSVFEATLLEKQAPVTCATLSKHLPLKAPAMHAAWSGECIFVPDDRSGVLWDVEQIPPENKTIYGSAGDVAWNTDPAFKEICITWGQSQYRYNAGPMVLNLFARITEKLEELENVCNEIRRTGTKEVLVREM